jgi:hypothetical protein
MIFKTQHPQSLISRMFILEYMRMLDKDMMYAKANEYQKNKYFYTYEGEQDGHIKDLLDLNWEYLLFEATITELEHFMKNFLEQLLEIDEKMKAVVERMKAESIVEQARVPVDINLMSVAKSDLENSKGKLIT